MKTKDWLSIIMVFVFFIVLLYLENHNLKLKLKDLPQTKTLNEKYYEECKNRAYDYWLPVEYKQGHKTFEEFYSTVSQYVWEECKVFY